MKTRIDALSKRILANLNDTHIDVNNLAERAGCTPEVAEARLERLRASGVLRGVQARVDRAQIGRPHEIMVTGAPSSATDAEALQALCKAQGVTRVWTMASRNSVAFTVVGQNMDDVKARAAAIAQEAGLQDARSTLIVNTLLDDDSRAVQDAFDPNLA